MMEAFNNPIPENPAKAGRENYQREKQKLAEKKERESFDGLQKEKKYSAPFEKELTERQKKIETMEQRNRRFAHKIENHIIILEEQLKKAPEHLKNRQGYEEQIEKLRNIKLSIESKNNG